jgi:hypothetical protein
VKRWCLVILTAGLALGPATALDEPKADRPAGAPLAAEKRDGSQSLEGRLKTLKKEVDDARAAYEKAATAYKEGDPEDPINKLWKEYTRAADANIPKVLEIVRKDPKSALAFESLDWIAVVPRNIFQPYCKQAIELLRAHHSENPKIGRACGVMGAYADWQHPPTMELMRAVAEKNPDRVARGQAMLAWARLTWKKAKTLEYRTTGDTKPVFDEAERLFDVVASKYGNCPHLARGKGTLGEAAKSELYELRFLAVGKASPEISGEDFDGHKFKLSDYRGKVVVLDFWGHW